MLQKASQGCTLMSAVHLCRPSELAELLHKRRAVREGVVMLTERAACMDYAENNDAEVQRVGGPPTNLTISVPGRLTFLE